MLFLIVIATAASTLLGGALALKISDKLHLILGFSAGAVMGVAFFDLLPEALEIGQPFFSTSTLTAVMALGFGLYLVLDRWIFFHSHESDSARRRRGILGAASLSFHSFLDGVAIGIAYQVSVSVGLVVTAAVLTHDFSDGINTVNLILKNGGSRRTAWRWLALDALAPALGVLSTTFLNLPEAFIGPLLALFVGFFLYLGASDLVPESHHAHPKFLTTFVTLLGLATIFLVVNFAGL